MYALIADCVSKAFGNRKILTSATLRATAGEVRAIFGRNGIGKSTLLKIAVGWMQPDSGVVRMGEATFLRASAEALAVRGVFYLPDHAALSTTLNVQTQLHFYEQRFGRCTAQDAARVTGIGHLLNRRRSSLSAGELRRCELAMAIARAPTVLIADEPYRGIAPSDHDEITRILRQLAGSGCAVVVTGHDVPSLLAAADQVTWCTDGTTYELGAPKQACMHEGFRRGYLGPRFQMPF